jgi:cyclopropane fatty-acyl-phospholipid synthase-like methyltransferase
MLKRSLSLGLFALLLAIVFNNAPAGEKNGKKEDAKYSNPTYVPTADEVINKMFEMGKVNGKDVIFDLGCGDGRILYMAAQKFGARGVGVELNPVRIREAMDQAEKYKVGTLVEIRHGDALKVKDLSDATVVVMYMFPEFMDLWFPIAKEKLKPGTRILSHDYKWTNGWEPAAEEVVKSSHRDNHRAIMWVVPERK